MDDRAMPSILAAAGSNQVHRGRDEDQRHVGRQIWRCCSHRRHAHPLPDTHKLTVRVMELELKKMEETVKSIHAEMFYLRKREEEMQELNRTTKSRMAWLSFLSLFICLSVAFEDLL